MWGNNIRLTVFRKTKYYFFSWIESPDKPTWILVTVYGDASYRDNRAIWADIASLTNWNRPICCIGDFNATSNPQDKFAGSPNFNSNSRQFTDFIFDAGLIDLVVQLSHIGQAFCDSQLEKMNN
jgi:hypothetical protein